MIRCAMLYCMVDYNHLEMVLMLMLVLMLLLLLGLMVADNTHRMTPLSYQPS